MLQLNNGEQLKILQKKRCRIANFEDFVVIFVLFETDDDDHTLPVTCAMRWRQFTSATGDPRKLPGQKRPYSRPKGFK